MFNSNPKTPVRLQKIQDKNLNYSSERPFMPSTSSKQHGNSEGIRAFFVFYLIFSTKLNLQTEIIFEPTDD